jgi:hypothetical protein
MLLQGVLMAGSRRFGEGTMNAVWEARQCRLAGLSCMSDADGGRARQAAGILRALLRRGIAGKVAGKKNAREPGAAGEVQLFGERLEETVPI